MDTIHFGVGAAKSGSHSLAGMFSSAIRVAHEPRSEAFVALALDHADGRLPDDELTRQVHDLIVDERAQLNVAAINGYLITSVFQAFPHSKYVLTVRDPGSWLRSLINHMSTHSPPPTSPWHAFRDLRFGRHGQPHRLEDDPLRKSGFQGVDSYLSYWLKHNLTVIETVPSRQLRITPTSKLTRDGSQIATFLGLPATAVEVEQSHLYRGEYGRKSPVDGLAPNYLAERLSTYSASLARQAAPHLDAKQMDLLSETLSGSADASSLLARSAPRE
jgi:Sulfotransferase domain